MKNSNHLRRKEDAAEILDAICQAEFLLPLLKATQTAWEMLTVVDFIEENSFSRVCWCSDVAIMVVDLHLNWEQKQWRHASVSLLTKGEVNEELGMPRLRRFGRYHGMIWILLVVNEAWIAAYPSYWAGWRRISRWNASNDTIQFKIELTRVLDTFDVEHV